MMLWNDIVHMKRKAGKPAGFNDIEQVQRPELHALELMTRQACETKNSFDRSWKSFAQAHEVDITRTRQSS